MNLVRLCHENRKAIYLLTALMFVGPVEEKRFVDVSENALYWYFVVLTWLPIYVVLYWAPRVT